MSIAKKFDVRDVFRRWPDSSSVMRKLGIYVISSDFKSFQCFSFFVFLDSTFLYFTSVSTLTNLFKQSELSIHNAQNKRFVCGLCIC